MLNGESQRQSFFLPLLVPLLLGGGLWLTFFWSMLCGLSVPGFRDSAYLYYPLFEWLDSEWSKGQIPLWNPYCNLGMSNVGDNTTSLFYPGKLVFILRFLDYPVRYGLYIALHVLLAGIGTFYFARTLRASLPGATLASISYAGSGAVLTQANNAVFLVSAAWLPFAMAAVWKMNSSRNRDGIKWGVIAGITCALMVLGGDPQMVYHVGLITAATVAFKTLGQIKRRRRSSSKTPVSGGSSYVPGLAMVTMVVVTTLLALIQIVPTYQWSKLSERSSVERPTLYELLVQEIVPPKPQAKSYIDSESEFETESNLSWQSLIEPLQSDSVSFANYEFSLAPWTLFELFVPNGSGRSFPTHQRWADVMNSPQGVPDRVWFPSIYLGAVTAWLGLSGLKLRRAGRQVWLSRIAVFFLLGSFGWYGLSWFLPIPNCGSQVGGVYWWMNLLLPNYSSFRYPAKLFVIVSLSLSVLAGLQLNFRKFRSLNRVKMNIGWAWLGMLVIGMFALKTGGFDAILEKLPSDPLFGPIDLANSIQGLKLSLVHSLFLVAVVVIGVIWSVTELDLGNRKINLPLWLLVAVTAVDLVVANHWVLALVPSEAFTAKVDLPKMDLRGVEPVTVYRKRDGYVPDHWAATPSFDRLSEIIRWQRETLYPKQHLGHGVRLLGSFGSIQPKQNEDMLKMLDELPAGIKPALFDPKKKDSIGEEVLENPALDIKKSHCEGELVSNSTNKGNNPKITFWRNRSNLIMVRPVKLESESDANERLDFQFEVVEFSSNAISIKVRCRKDCELVHDSLFDGNWEATTKSIPTGLISTQKLMEFDPGSQGLRLEAGEYEINLNYVPLAFWRSAWISSISWVIVVLYLAVSRPRK